MTLTTTSSYPTDGTEVENALDAGTVSKSKLHQRRKWDGQWSSTTRRGKDGEKGGLSEKLLLLRAMENLII